MPGDELRAMQASDSLKTGDSVGGRTKSLFKEALEKAKLIKEQRLHGQDKLSVRVTHVDDGEGIGIPRAERATAVSEDAIAPPAATPSDELPGQVFPALASEDSSAMRFEQSLYGSSMTPEPADGAMSADDEVRILSGLSTRE